MRFIAARVFKLGVVIVLGVTCLQTELATAQASAIQSAQPAVADTQRGHVLLDKMVQALGGDAWLNRKDWTITGKTGTFYKGKPEENVYQFEEYHRVTPFATRVVIVTHFGPLIATDHRDIAELWVGDTGYEISYRGKKDLLPEDVAEFERRRAHSLDAVILDWLKQPGVEVAFAGTSTVERRLALQVSVTTLQNDSATLEIDETTHLPLSLTFQYRDPKFHDLDRDREEFDDYHDEQGVMTPLTVSRYHNGELSGQRFLTSVKYNTGLDPNLFDPERPLTKKNK